MDSDFFNVNYLEVAPSVNNTPSVSIASPPDGGSFLTTDAISFNGSGTDLEDGSLTQGSLVWVSSIDGQIGAGQTAQASLGAGIHTITLTATDSAGASSSDTVTITVVNLVYGDVTGDGQFAGEDIYLAMDWIIGRKPMPPVGTPALVAGDVNGDGIISSTDVGLMIARYLGAISKFPVEP
jgi:hypothetical protein